MLFGISLHWRTSEIPGRCSLEAAAVGRPIWIVALEEHLRELHRQRTHSGKLSEGVATGARPLLLNSKAEMFAFDPKRPQRLDRDAAMESV